MVDKLSKEHRSWNMSRIRGSDTKPEMTVRSFLHRAGLRFRLHKKDLPGKPDIVLSKYRTCIFVHGCYWHRHNECQYTYMPKTRVEFWEEKFFKNIERDQRKIKQLENMGWNVLVVWECETKNPRMIASVLTPLLKSQRGSQ